MDNTEINKEQIQESLNEVKKTITQFDDDYLLRFLKARKYQIEKTIEMLDKNIAWRSQYLSGVIIGFVFDELELVQQQYPHGYHKTDKKGRPIYIERIGLIHTQQLFSLTTEERLARYFVQQMEDLIDKKLPACSKAVGSQVEQFTVILDLKVCIIFILFKGQCLVISTEKGRKKVYLFELQAYNYVQQIAKIANENYPELVYKYFYPLGKIINVRIFIVNASINFQGIWSMIKQWIDEGTRSKIQILGANYLEQLLESMKLD